MDWIKMELYLIHKMIDRQILLFLKMKSHNLIIFQNKKKIKMNKLKKKKKEIRNNMYVGIGDWMDWEAEVGMLEKK